MKKHAAILLLLVLLFNTVGLYGIFQVQRYFVRKEVKHYFIEHVNEARLVLITVPKAELQTGSIIQWVEPHEFRHQGKMYDIVRTVETDSTIIYHSFHDHKEDILFATLEEETDEKMKGKAISLILAGFTTAYFNDHNPFKIHLTGRLQLYNYLQTAYLQPYIILPYPPPKV